MVSAMPIGKIVTIVLASTGCGGVAGGLLGFAMGTWLPGFYHDVPVGGGDMLYPVQTGTGLGISEGIGLGFLLGVLIVCVQAFGRKKAKSR